MLSSSPIDVADDMVGDSMAVAAKKFAADAIDDRRDNILLLVNGIGGFDGICYLFKTLLWCIQLFNLLITMFVYQTS